MTLSTFGGSSSAGGDSTAVGDGMVVGQVVQAAGGSNLLPADGRILQKLDYPLAYDAMQNSAIDIATLQINTTALTTPSVTGTQQAIAYNAALDMFAMLAGSQVSLSTDSGKTWNSYPLPSSISFAYIVSSDDKFCIVSTANNISAISSDGINWTLGTAMPMAAPLSGLGTLGYTGSRFIMTSGIVHMYSVDGLNWTTPNIPISRVNKIIRQPNGNYFAYGLTNIAGAATNQVAVSTDGVNWIARTLPFSDTFLSASATATTMLLMSATRGYSSTDGGMTWNAVTYSGGFTALASALPYLSATDSTFIVTLSGVPTGGVASAIYKSTDGAVWTLINANSVFNSDFTLYAASDAVQTIVVPLGRTTSCQTVLTSKDLGVTWQISTLPVAAAWNFVIWTGNKFVMFCHTSATSLQSADGLTWTVASTTMPVTMTAQAGLYAYNAALGLHMMCMYGAATTIMYTSPDAITWTSRTITSGSYFGLVCKGVYNLLSGIAGANLTSNDGITWSVVAINATAANFMVAYNSTVWLRVQTPAAALTTAIPTNTNTNAAAAPFAPASTTWTLRALPAVATGFFPTALFVVGETFYVLSPNTNSMMTSTDGITWTLISNVWQSTFVPYSTNAFGTCMMKVGSGYGMLSRPVVNSSDSVFVYSTDMQNWTQTNRVPRAGSAQIQFSGNRGLSGGGTKLVASNGPFIARYDDQNGLTFSIIPVSANGSTLTANAGYGLNGANYNVVQKPNGDVFLFCSSSGNTDGNGLRTSNFANWTRFVQPELSVFSYDAVYAAGKMLFIGTGSNATLYETDDGSSFVKYPVSSWTNGIFGNMSRVLSSGIDKAFIAYTTAATTGTATVSGHSFYDGTGVYNTVPFNSNLIALAPGIALARKGNLIVMGMRAASFGAVSISQDGGVTWRIIDLGIGALGVGSISYNPVSDIFVLLSSASNGLCYTSKDGINWIPRSMPSAAVWYSLSVYRGLFIATVYQTNVWAYSRDGISWNTFTAPLAGTANMYYYSAANASVMLTLLYGAAVSYAGAIVRYYDAATQFQLPAYMQTPGQPSWFVKVQ